MKKDNGKAKLRLFGTMKTLCACALLAAAAVSIAYVCKFFTVGSLRLTFENLPIILAGILFGPAAGFITGISADFISTAISQYGLGGMNPLITLAAGTIGLVAGLIYRTNSKKEPGSLRICAAVASSHIIGNMIMKSAALMIYYGYALPAVLPRIPLYIVIGAVECTLILLLLKSKGVRRAAEALR